MIKVIGLFWVTACFVYFWALMSYPTNYYDILTITTDAVGSILLLGGIFGFDMILFYTAFTIMYDKLSTLYLRRIKFSFFSHILKNIIYYCVCLSLMICIMNFIYPFIGQGPLFAFMTNKYIVQNCNDYWYSNILFISDFYPWNL